MHSVTSDGVSKALSYSEAEQFTGSYWIDGKPIYRKVFLCTTNFTFQVNTWYNINSYFNGIDSLVPRIDNIINVKFCIRKTYVWNSGLFLINYPSSGGLGMYSSVSSTVEKNKGFIVVEYTKTTD